MPDFWTVLGFVAIPAVGSLVGGVLAEVLTLSDRTISLIMHWAAGTLLGVIGVELMPRALEAGSPWVMVPIFLSGGIFLLALDWLTQLVQAEAGKAERSPLLVFMGVTIDFFTDGITIGAGSTFSTSMALLLGLALISADTPESFSTISEVKRGGRPAKIRYAMIGSFPVILLLGGLVGYWGLRGQSELVRAGVLAFTAGEVLLLVVSELIPRSHERWRGRLAGFLLLSGFAVFVLLSGLMGQTG